MSAARTPSSSPRSVRRSSAASSVGLILSAQMRQAQRMVAVQAHCSLEQALERIEQRALDRYRTLDEMAEMILDGTARFTL
jgi:hypothetical protein